MKIIFLDIDGVMDDKQFVKENGYSRPFSDNLIDFSPRCVTVLNEITNTTNAKIVLSSTWRTNYKHAELEGKINSALDAVKELFSKNGVTGEVIGITPIMGHKNYHITRSLEILTWLSNRSDIDNWVAIDDDRLYLSEFVRTKYPYCLANPRTVREVIQVLTEGDVLDE
jgi:hypothetical protein